MESKKPGTFSPTRTDELGDPEKSGVRRAWDEVKQGVEDAVEDVKEGIARVRNNARYGVHGSEPGIASSSSVVTSPPEASDSVDKLQDCLRGELSAVETYDLALRSVKDAELGNALRQLRDSHDRRVLLLRDRLRQYAAEPTT